MREIPGEHYEVTGRIKYRVAIKSWKGCDLDLMQVFLVPHIQDIDVKIVRVDSEVPFGEDDHLFRWMREGRPIPGITRGKLAVFHGLDIQYVDLHGPVVCSLLLHLLLLRTGRVEFPGPNRDRSSDPPPDPDR